MFFVFGNVGFGQVSFNGNGNNGFGDVLGNGDFIINDDGTTVTITFTKGVGEFNNALVIYIDSESGGFNTTSNFTDTGDELRKAISGTDGTNRSTVFFPAGFEANHAIVAKPTLPSEFGGLWSLVNNGSHSFITSVNLTPADNNSSSTYTMSFNFSDINTTSGSTSFKLVATYLNQDNAFRSDEAIGDGIASGNPGQNPVTFYTYFEYSSGDKGGLATSASAGNWSSTATWTNGNVPLDSDAVEINHDVILDQNASVTSVTISTGNTLTSESSQSRVLSINDGGTLTNNGTFTAGTGKVVFAGAGTVAGSSTTTFNDVDISAGVNFGSSSTIDGTLTVKAGGFANTNAPTYGGTSTLSFDTGGEYTIDGGATIWTSGSSLGKGVPNNVTVATTTPLNIYQARDVTGNLTINSDGSVVQGNNAFIIQGNLTNAGTFSFAADGAQPLIVKGDLVNQNGATITLSNEIGGDMHLEGDYQSSGTVNFNNRAIFFKGDNAQSVAGDNDPINFDYLFVEKVAATTLTFDQNVSVNNKFDQITGNATIASGKTLTIDVSAVADIASGSTLTTNGGLVLNSDANGAGSLIVDGTVSGDVNVNRYIAAANWASGTDGWHLLSSPVASQSISGSWTPDGNSSNNYDFYAWNEANNIWVNFKNTTTSPTWAETNGDNNFTVGRGYIVAYQALSTNTFTGIPNKDDVVANTLTRTTGAYTDADDAGFNVLGNPFPSAIQWNDGNWTLTNISTTAKLWNSGNKSYDDLGANDIIPAHNGFVVQLTSGTTGSITIPEASRTHSATNWFKVNDSQKIKFIAREADGSSAQTSNLVLSEQATENYNPGTDAIFLPGYAPHFYSIKENKNLSTYAINAFDEEMMVPYGFVSNGASAYEIELIQSIDLQTIYLTDNQTGVQHNLTENPVYHFTSSEGDNPNRFLIHFGALSLDESSLTTAAHAYVHNSTLYVLNASGQTQVDIIDLQGRKLQSSSFRAEGLYSETISLPTGVYVVRVMDEKGVKTAKVVVE